MVNTDLAKAEPALIAA
jgi:dynein heavy chain 1